MKEKKSALGTFCRCGLGPLTQEGSLQTFWLITFILWVKHFYPDGSVLFRDDSAPIHRIQALIKWFDEHESDANHQIRSHSAWTPVEEISFGRMTLKETCRIYAKTLKLSRQLIVAQYLTKTCYVFVFSPQFNLSPVRIPQENMHSYGLKMRVSVWLRYRLGFLKKHPKIKLVWK